MTHIEEMKRWLEALEHAAQCVQTNYLPDQCGHDWDEQIESLRQAIATEESSATQETVAWLITDEAINSIQVASIQRLIDRLKHAHHTDLCVRINGQDEWFQADWIKHLQRAHLQPKAEQEPKREPLTDEQIDDLLDIEADKPEHQGGWSMFDFARAIEAAHGIKGNT